MARYEYQQSAYGRQWETSEACDDFNDPILVRRRSNFWVAMLSERHHQIVDTETGSIVWSYRSEIAPPPGSKEKV